MSFVQVRADICHDCPSPCEMQRDDAAHRNRCATCPLGKWGRWDCDLPNPPPAALEPTWSLFRRVRSYRRAGYLVGLLEFLRRRDACRRCDQATTLPTHPGLYGCGSCSSCTGGPERMLSQSTICPKGKWL